MSRSHPTRAVVFDLDGTLADTAPDLGGALNQLLLEQGRGSISFATGMAVIQLLTTHFEQLLEYSFTSEMEESLDKIAYGQQDWIKYLDKFYNGKGGLAKKVEEQDKKIKPEESRTYTAGIVLEPTRELAAQVVGHPVSDRLAEGRLVERDAVDGRSGGEGGQQP